MKKLFSAFTAVLLAFCFISCAPQELSDRSSKNEGSVSLSIRSPRTISPAEGISYKDVKEWTVTFKDRTAQYDDIEKTVSFIGNEPQEIRLPIGTYNVTLNGTAKNPMSDETAQTVHFYGEASVTVEGGTPVPISVFVAPKKSADGTGSFNFTVTTSGFGNNSPTTNIVDISTGRNNYFTVSLTPYGGENPVATWTPTDIYCPETVSEVGRIYSFSVSSAALESQSVPSGFYTLSIKYTWVVGEDSIGQLLTKTKEIYSPYHDFLVEIIDGLTTNGSADITVSLEDSKTYYATTDATKAKGNGAFASMPGYFDDVLDAVNRTTISTANIYIVDEVLTDGTITYPEIEIDVSKVNEKGKTYCIYTKSEKEPGIYNKTPFYTITGAAVEGGEPTIDIERSVTPVTLKNSQSSSGRAKIVVSGRPEFVLKDNTSVFIDLTDEKNQIAYTTICMPPDSTTFDSYYVENPCVTVKNHSTTQTIFSVSLEEKFSNSYSVVTNSSDNGTYKTTNFYIMPSYTAELPVTGIPNYDLVVTKGGQLVTDNTKLYAGDTVEIKATPEGSFANDTSFTWFINGKQYGDSTTDSWCKITIGAKENNTGTNNTIICLVKYGEEFATRTIPLTAQEKTIVLYNKTSYTNKPVLSYATLTNDSVSSPKSLIADTSTEIVDYCFDASNNMYAIVSDGATSINKYTYNNGYNTNDVTTYTIEEGADVATIDYIEASSDDKLYAVIDSMYIAQLILTDSTTDANGTVSFNKYTLPIDWSDIKTFCTDGTNFYVIVSITSIDDSQSRIITVKLVSCTVSVDNQLTENKSILLASTVEGAKPVFSSSDYSDTLEYRDLCYINGKLYLLVRDVDYAITNNNPETPSTSRGALCTFTVSADGITADRIGIGYQTASSTISYTDDAGLSIKRTAYIGDGSTTFYGPVKFVARKEDELLIADDGYCVDSSSANVNTKNNIVKVNLNEESISSSFNLDSGYFDYDYSGRFGGSIYINGSQIIY